VSPITVNTNEPKGVSTISKSQQNEGLRSPTENEKPSPSTNAALLWSVPSESANPSSVRITTSDTSSNEVKRKKRFSTSTQVEVSKKCEKEKKYDPAEVKAFMEKQKELRRIKQQEEETARQKRSEKKALKLKKLEETCKEIASKSAVKGRKSLPTKIVPSTLPLSAIKNRHIPKTKDVANLDPETKLLREYEEIVKRECLGILEAQQRKSKSAVVHCEKVDKAVETGSDKIFEETEQERMEKDLGTKLNKVIRHSRVIDSKLAERAASKIQAGFRGYKVRKLLKEANLLPLSVRHLPMQFSDASSFNFQSPRRNSLVFSTPNRRRSGSFDEPYPAEAIQRLRQFQHHMKINVPTTPRRFSSPGNMCLPIQNKTPSSTVVPISTAFQSKLQSQLERTEKDVLQNKAQRSSYIDPIHPTINDVLNFKFKSIRNEQFEKTNRGGSLQNLVFKEKTASSEQNYSSDFEPSDTSFSVSQGKLNENKNFEKLQESEDQITDGYFGPSNASTQLSSSHIDTNRIKKFSKHHKRSRKANVVEDSDSSTTVDTDIELKRADKRFFSKSDLQNKSETASTTITETSSNLSSMMGPALNLRYQAEKEKLDILNKALLVTTNYEKEKNHRCSSGSADKPAENELNNFEAQRLKKCAAEESIRQKIQEENYKLVKEQTSAQLAMAECQKEAIKATAELTKWMSELKRHSVEDDRQTFAQKPIDLAAMVYAAVEGALVVGERRKEQERNHKQNVKRKRVSVDSESLEDIRPKRIQVQKIYCKDEQVQFPSAYERPYSSVGEDINESLKSHEQDETCEDIGSKLEESLGYEDTFESDHYDKSMGSLRKVRGTNFN